MPARPKDTLRAARELLRSIRRGGERGRVAVEGVRLVAEVIDRGAPLDLLLCSPRIFGRPGLDAEAGRVVAHPGCRMVSDRELAGLASGPSHQGVLAVVRMPLFAPEDCVRRRSVLVCLDGVQDPANLGMIARAARAFAAAGIWYREGGARPDNPRAFRAAGGALLEVPVAPVGDLDAALAALGWPVFIADAAGAAIDDVWPPALPLALVMGSEGHGPQVARGTRVAIAMEPESESLNVAQAATILLARVHRALRA